MVATVEYTRDLGNGQVQVFSRSSLGHPFSVIVGRHRLNTPELYLVLAVRSASVDREVASIRAHQQRGVS